MMIPQCLWTVGALEENPCKQNKNDDFPEVFDDAKVLVLVCGRVFASSESSE